MVGVLALFFSHRTEQELLKGVTKLVKKALELKKHVSEENALYYFNRESGGKQFDPCRTDHSGEHSEGMVAFCTFPGLVRMKLQMKDKVSITVVKGSILLQSDIN